MRLTAAQGRPVAQDNAELDTEELRLRRIQEKNRRNQRKFRARQRVRPQNPPTTDHRPTSIPPNRSRSLEDIVTRHIGQEAQSLHCRSGMRSRRRWPTAAIGMACTVSQP